MIFSATFNQMALQHFDYLAQKTGASQAHSLLTDTISTFAQRIGTHPHSAPVCLELSELGLKDYFDYIDSSSQFRIIYRVDKHNIYALLLLNTRQSMERALINHCLMI
ncbi:MAG: hypothetical protein RL217_1554 [Pseudomonadota bacterium]